MAGLQVYFSPQFKKLLVNYPKADQVKIREFVEYVKQQGFDGLQGLNKSSDNVPTDDPNWFAKVKQAQKYHLWHYHIGIPHYTMSQKGNYATSEYVLHYIKEQEAITIVYMSPHPPFELPDKVFLENITDDTKK